jgi:hypothetical protein
LSNLSLWVISTSESFSVKPVPYRISPGRKRTILGM